MKSKFRLAIIALVITTCSIANASAQVAHIHFDSLITLLPESKVAQQKIQDYAQQLEEMVIAMETELQTKVAQFQANEKGMPDLVRNVKEQELQELNQRIQDFRQQAQADYQKKSAELSQPVIDKAKKAIDEVAKEKGYKYVLDTSSGVVLYNSSDNNIMSLVIKKLGILIPAAVVPAIPVIK